MQMSEVLKCGVWLQVFSRTKWYRFPKLRVYVHIDGSEFGAREREEKNFFFKEKMQQWSYF